MVLAGEAGVGGGILGCGGFSLAKEGEWGRVRGSINFWPCMKTTDTPALHRYDLPEEAGWRGWAGWVPWGVWGSTVLMTVLMFPPSPAPELAYVFAAPALFWAWGAPGWGRFVKTILSAQAVAWVVVLGWLHHVTVGGLVLLGPLIGVWVGSWYLVARWVLPRLRGRSFLVRLTGLFGLAGAWVGLEWSRTWVLSGFPWLPLSATQWERGSILQVAAWAGAWGVSFILISVNLGFTAYARRLLVETHVGWRRRSPEFLVVMVLLLGCLALHVRETFNRSQFELPLARVGWVQPYIPQAVKWEESEGPAILRVLEVETQRAAGMRPDFILWPEATTPWAVRGGALVAEWTERLVRVVGVPVVMGSIAIERPRALDEAWFNGVFVVSPESGVAEEYYAKRKLVPFGEFVPVRSLLGWIGKFVPIGGDFARGKTAEPLRVGWSRGESGAGRELALGALICYEDIFPGLARAGVRAGAEVLTVHSNNGWFGEGGAAYQHAAHSVLRAVELRRPVLRTGNGGWSGWIDEFGAVRAVLTKDEAGEVLTRPGAGQGTVYFRGVAAVDVTVDARWVGRLSFYARHGDWFVGVSLLLVLATWGLVRRSPEGGGRA